MDDENDKLTANEYDVAVGHLRKITPKSLGFRTLVRYCESFGTGN